jgi:predicted phosphodiesterase
MRLAAFSDIHGNLIAMEAMLADLESVGEVDMVWFLGDLSAFGPRPAECIHRLQQVAEHFGEKQFKAIGGNTDRYLVTGERFRRPPAPDQAAFEKLLPLREPTDAALNWNLSRLSWEDYEYLTKLLHRETSLRVKDYGTVIGYHAIPGDDEKIINPQSPDSEVLDALLDREGRLAIGGHIHMQMDRQVGDWRVVNIGSVGMSFDQPGMAQWGLFTFADGKVDVDLRSVPYDLEAAVADLHAAGHPVPAFGERQLRQR